MLTIARKVKNVKTQINNDHHVILIDPLAAHGNTVKDNVFLPQNIIRLNCVGNQRTVHRAFERR